MITLLLLLLLLVTLTCHCLQLYRKQHTCNTTGILFLYSVINNRIIIESEIDDVYWWWYVNRSRDDVKSSAVAWSFIDCAVEARRANIPSLCQRASRSVDVVTHRQRLDARRIITLAGITPVYYKRLTTGMCPCEWQCMGVGHSTSVFCCHLRMRRGVVIYVRSYLSHNC